MLGVERDASARSIKVAYRALARRYHPDHNPHDPEAEEHFKRIQEAYGVLSDRRKRAKYDQRRWGDSFVTPSGHAYRSSGQFTRRETGEPNPRGNVFGEALGAVRRFIQLAIWKRQFARFGDFPNYFAFAGASAPGRPRDHSPSER